MSFCYVLNCEKESSRTYIPFAVNKHVTSLQLVLVPPSYPFVLDLSSCVECTSVVVYIVDPTDHWFGYIIGTSQLKHCRVIECGCTKPIFCKTVGCSSVNCVAHVART